MREDEPILHCRETFLYSIFICSRAVASDTRLNLSEKNSRYEVVIKPPRVMLIEVAIAAPLTPIPKGKTNTQSRKAFIEAGIILHHMAYLGEPSILMMNSPINDHI